MIDEKKKKKLAMYLAIIMITLAFMIVYQPQLTSKYVITYGDGCKETYENNTLTSKMCIAGRIMNEEAKNKIKERTNPTFNTTLLNNNTNWSMK